MHEFNIQTIGFYAAVYAVAFSACVARTLREPDGLNWRYSTSLGLSSGFLAFGACCLLVVSPTSNSFNPWYYLGGSALLGLLAKEQDHIAKRLISKVMFAGRKMFDEEIDKNEDANR